MRLYMWTALGDDPASYVSWDMSHDLAVAVEKRTRTTARGWSTGPLVTVDLPEPGTTKGKRKGKK